MHVAATLILVPLLPLSPCVSLLFSPTLAPTTRVQRYRQSLRHSRRSACGILLFGFMFRIRAHQFKSLKPNAYPHTIQYGLSIPRLAIAMTGSTNASSPTQPDTLSCWEGDVTLPSTRSARPLFPPPPQNQTGRKKQVSEHAFPPWPAYGTEQIAAERRIQDAGLSAPDSPWSSSHRQAR